MYTPVQRNVKFASSTTFHVHYKVPESSGTFLQLQISYSSYGTTMPETNYIIETISETRIHHGQLVGNKSL